MSVTKRFILIVCAGLPGAGICAFFGFHTIFFILYNALCFGLLGMDYLLSPAADYFSVRRPDEDKLYFKTENTIRILVKNMSSRSVKMEVNDDVPDRHFKVIRRSLSKALPPSGAGRSKSEHQDLELFAHATGEVEFSYGLIPSKRGSYMFHDIYIRYAGYLGLCQKYARYQLPKEYKVYPNLRDMSKYRLMTRKNRRLSAGERRVAMRGNTSEFESLRDYIDGDDYRRINWMATARGHKLMVNQYESEKNQPVFIMVDAGRPMSYSAGGYKKLDYAVNTALILADIVNQNGDNSGLMVFDTEVRTVVPAGKGQAHRNNLMEALYHIEDTKNVSDYEGAFLTFCERQKRRSIIFIFTDFETLEEAHDLAEYISVLKRRHVPIIILMENNALKKTAKGPDNSLKEVYRKGVAKDFLAQRAKIIKALNAKGIFCAESSIEDFTLTAVNSYLSVRA